jgi:hypothetical protein
MKTQRSKRFNQWPAGSFNTEEKRAKAIRRKGLAKKKEWDQ